MQGIVVGWQIYELTKDPLSLGMIGLAEAVPAIGVALYAGHLADIHNRKRMVLWNGLLFALCSVGLLYLSLNPDQLLSHSVWPIYALIFVTGIARGFMSPAIFALYAQIVPRELYGNAGAWSSSSWHIGAIAGPAIGGLLYGFLGVAWTYGIDLALIIIALIVFGLITYEHTRKEKTGEPIMQSLFAGARFVLANKPVLAAMSLDLFAVFFGGAVALLPIFAGEILKVGPEGLGLLRAAPAIGAVLMGFGIAFNPLNGKIGKKLLWAVAGFGLTIIAFGVSRNFYLSLAMLALGGAFDNVSVVIRGLIIQLSTPDNMRGRVASVNMMFIGSSNEIGAFESGVTAKLMGTVAAVIFGGTMTVLTVMGVGRFVPALQELEHEG